MLASWRVKAKLVLAHWLLSERLMFLYRVLEFDDLGVGLAQAAVVADDGGVAWSWFRRVRARA